MFFFSNFSIFKRHKPARTNSEPEEVTEITNNHSCSLQISVAGKHIPECSSPLKQMQTVEMANQETHSSMLAPLSETRNRNSGCIFSPQASFQFISNRLKRMKKNETKRMEMGEKKKKSRQDKPLAIYLARSRYSHTHQQQPEATDIPLDLFSQRIQEHNSRLRYDPQEGARLEARFARLGTAYLQDEKRMRKVNFRNRYLRSQLGTEAQKYGKGDMNEDVEMVLDESSTVASLNMEDDDAETLESANQKRRAAKHLRDARQIIAVHVDNSGW
jgi:hypothetical protein